MYSGLNLIIACSRNCLVKYFHAVHSTKSLSNISLSDSAACLWRETSPCCSKFFWHVMPHHWTLSCTVTRLAPASRRQVVKRIVRAWPRQANRADSSVISKWCYFLTLGQRTRENGKRWGEGGREAGREGARINALCRMTWRPWMTSVPQGVATTAPAKSTS